MLCTTATNTSNTIRTVDQFWLSYWQTDAVSDWQTADHVRNIAATSFSLLQQLCTIGNESFYIAGVNIFVGELNAKYLPDKYFITGFWVAKSYIAVCFNYILRMAIFWA